MTPYAFAASYLAMANVFNRPDLFFRNRWLGLAGSHLFFGALILFGLLLVVRVGGRRRANALRPRTEFVTTFP